MKTKLTNGARTPRVIYEELRKVGKFVGMVTPRNSAIYYEYFVTPQFEDSPAVEITATSEGEIIATRQIDKSALPYLIPNYQGDIKYKDTIPDINERLAEPNDNFTFGGF